MFRRCALMTLLSLCGCTTQLETQKIATSSGAITEGVTYQLPRLIYTVDVTRTLATCGTSDTPLQFDIASKASSSIVADEPVVISYTELANAMKTTDFSLELYPSGVLKSVNATIEDRTAAIATEGFKAAASIAKMVIGLPPAAGPGVAARNYLTCTPAAEKLLASLPALRAIAKSAEASEKAAAKTVSDFEEANKGSPLSEAKIAELKKLSDAKSAATVAKTAANKALSETGASLTLLSQVQFTPEVGTTALANTLVQARDGKAKPEDLLELRFEVQHGEWFAIPLNDRLEPDVTRARWIDEKIKADLTHYAQVMSDLPSQALLEQLRNADVVITSQPLNKESGATNGLAAATTCQTGGSACGVLYRTRAPARLRICTRGDLDTLPTPDRCQALAGASKALLFSEDKAIPQLGHLMSLPLRNRLLENNSLSAEFAEDGGLVKFSYRKPKAKAEVALQTVNSGLTSLADVIAFEKGSELRALQEQKAIAEARLGLVNANKPLQPSEVTALNNEGSLLQAQIDKTQKQIDLIKKKRELDALLQTGD